MRIAAAMLVLLMAACAPRPNGGGNGEVPDLLPSVHVTTGNDSVEFVLQVTNTTGSEVDVTFTSGQSFDFVVFDAAGEEVWRWSADQMFTQAMREEEIEAGETVTYSAIWVPAPGTSGEFEVLGTLTAQNREVGQRTEFRVP